MLRAWSSGFRVVGLRVLGLCIGFIGFVGFMGLQVGRVYRVCRVYRG